MKRTPAILAKIPFVNLARKVYWEFLEGKLPQFCFRWPIYDVWRYFVNGESRKLYRLDKERMAPSPLEATVIRELKETGISMVQLNDLLPDPTFNDIQKWAEALLRAPAIEERIKAIEGGARPDHAKSGKFYIVRPLGTPPVVDTKDAIMELSLSDSILRIVCGYLGMFARLTAVNLWYNIATDGPDVFSQRWHRDPEDRKIVKTFLYLRDVDETNGPFCYVRGSHNGGRFRGIYLQNVYGSSYPDDGFVDQNYPSDLRQVCTGKAGTLIFCDTTGFHRGGHPKTGARLLFNGVYATNAAAPILVKAKLFSFGASHRDHLSPAARYAIGHLRDQ